MINIHPSIVSSKYGQLTNRYRRYKYVFVLQSLYRVRTERWVGIFLLWTAMLFLGDLTDFFFGYNTKLPLHMGRAERAAIFLTVTDWVLGLGPPADAGSWVLGLQGTLGSRLGHLGVGLGVRPQDPCQGEK